MKGFSTKKIKDDRTLGEILKAARRKKEVTLADAEAATKVRAKYLAALESGKWELLPQEVYTRGFVLAYIRYLDLTPNSVLPVFERESAFFQSKQQKTLSYQRSFQEARVIITPKLLAYFMLGFFVVSMLSYIVYQVAGFAGSPTLEVLSPQNNTVFEKEGISVAGITDADAMVTINDESIPVTSDGRFNLNLRLHRGVNVISVRAKNKAKKETAKVYTVEYRPHTAEAEIYTDRSF